VSPALGVGSSAVEPAAPGDVVFPSGLGDGLGLVGAAGGVVWVDEGVVSVDEVSDAVVPSAAVWLSVVFAWFGRGEGVMAIGPVTPA
jgi:hypothetical protein